MTHTTDNQGNDDVAAATPELDDDLAIDVESADKVTGGGGNPVGGHGGGRG
jgi:hypothetical protein